MAFLAARLAVLPLHALAPELARLRGRVLDVGSGYGLLARWLAELNPDVTVAGLEMDAGRVALAARSEGRAPRVRVALQDVRDLSGRAEATFDAAVAIDLIHHVPFPDQEALADALAGLVRPGGTLLVKDIARTPNWKHGFNRVHDHAMGDPHVNCREPEEMAALFGERGFAVEQVRRIAPWSPYPHYLVRMRRS
jgi:2-polyprenyl-3-methyl-5-hydroxy-6-metoxy-1,4-benzoquinol methylase